MRLRFSSDIDVSDAIGQAMIKEERKGVSMVEFRVYDVKGDGMPEAGDVGVEWSVTISVPIHWETVE